MLFRVNVIGTQGKDIVLYLSRVLQCLGRNVLIRDMTMGTVLEKSIPVPPGMDCTKSVIDHAGVGFISQKGVLGSYEASRIGDESSFFTEDQDMNAYDTCISFFDEKTLPTGSDLLIMVVSEDRGEIARMQSTISRVNRIFAGVEHLAEKRMILVRNYTGAVKGQFDELTELLKPQEFITLPVSRHDMKLAVFAQYSAVCSFRSASAPLEEALRRLAELACDEKSSREVLQAYKRASYGDVFFKKTHGLG